MRRKPSHRGAGVVGRNAKVILVQDAGALAFPVFEVVLLPLWTDGLLEKQAGGKIRETFGEPQVVIRSPADAMPEPLMGDLVGRHFLNEAAKLDIDAAKKHPTLRGIDISRNGQIDEVRPGLAKPEVGLLGDVQVVVRGSAKKQGTHLHLGAGLIQSVLGHRARGHTT